LRKGDYKINGTLVLDDYDIWTAAGGRYKAIVREFSATADGSGVITVQAITVVDNAKISGIEIVETFAPPANVERLLISSAGGFGNLVAGQVIRIDPYNVNLTAVVDSVLSATELLVTSLSGNTFVDVTWAFNVSPQYAGTIIATGGKEPYSYVIISGNLPPGLTLNAETGVIKGAVTI
jgi:hypothetical protein